MDKFQHALFQGCAGFGRWLAAEVFGKEICTVPNEEPLQIAHAVARVWAESNVCLLVDCEEKVSYFSRQLAQIISIPQRV